MSNKCDLVVGRKFTINTGNYSSIQPVASITVKDADISNIKKIHEALNTISSGFFHIQMNDDWDLMSLIKRIGLKDVIDGMDKEAIEKDIEDNIRLIIDIGDKSWEI